MSEAAPPHYTGHRTRLREKFAAAGPKALADYEVLELLLTYAIPRRDVKPLAKELLAKFGHVKGVLDADARALQETPGLGERAAGLMGLVRHVMRLYMEAELLAEGTVFSSTPAVVRFLKPALEPLAFEVFDVLFLSTKGHYLGTERLAQGTIDRTAVFPRRVVEISLKANAAAVIFAHNHPSGDPAPSTEDQLLTETLSQALRGVDIAVHDHIIIGKGRYYSFREAGVLA